MAKEEPIEALDEIARLLAIQLRLTLGSQRQAILELSRAGLSNSRIATLLGTSRDTVKAEIRRGRKNPST